ncbi:oxidoreductase [Roseibium aquae]|uniref:Oxidoreductase n=1 Tax=Roseibium aquae TaxID=1323746 RepID=A0A916TFG7_9HYPH|nr:SDR family NAD(P)-dependent oxidoreductase [Roseibium aquae]GGB42934.1 oxidoreductase [Roseibium aquae]
MHKDFEGRIAVVTGASRGLGYHLAKQLGARGAHVIALARTVGGLEELDDEIKAAGGPDATLVPVDLKDFDALDRLGAAIFERWKKLDILIGNAAVTATLSPVGHIKPKTFEEALATNVTANWRLIRSLDPLLRQSDAGRALFLTDAHADGQTPFWGIHATTKAALEAMVRTYAAETAKMAVRVNLADPGPMRTGLRAKAMPGENKDAVPHPSEVAIDLLPLLGKETTQTGSLFHRPSSAWKAV